MKSSKNVILIGMPGSGKSTVGVVLAKVLGYRFIDSDLEIQSQEGKRLPELIEEFGTEGFLDIEARVNASIEAERCVIATGGSVVYRDSAMQHLKEIGTVVYLKLTCEELEERLGDLRCRGVALQEGQTLQSLYEERIPLYEKYADTIEASRFGEEDRKWNDVPHLDGRGAVDRLEDGSDPNEQSGGCCMLETWI